MSPKVIAIMSFFLKFHIKFSMHLTGKRLRWGGGNVEVSILP